MIASGAALLVVGCTIGLIDRHVEIPERLAHACWVSALAAIVLAVVAAAVALTIAVPHPVRSLDQRWTSFSHGSGYTPDSRLHLFSSGTNRYDIWRVALDEFVSSPIIGVGSDNFAVDYLRQRRAREAPIYPHSIALRILSQTGIVGALLFVGFLAAAFTVVGRSVRRRDPAAAVAVAGASAFVYWFVHGTTDWLWEVPVLGTTAFALLAIAIRLGAGERTPPEARRFPVVAVAIGVVAVVLSFGLPWIAAQETAVAARTWVSHRRAAFRRLDMAATLNPLSDVPAETKGLIAARSNDPAVARRAFADAVARNSVNWFSQLELGTMDAIVGDRRAALSALARARSLNPRAGVIVTVQRDVRRGAEVSQQLVDSLLPSPTQASGSGG